MTLIFLTMIVFAACNPKDVVFKSDTVIKYSNLVKGYLERAHALTILLKPKNAFQKELYRMIAYQYSLAEKAYARARALELKGEYAKAVATYLVSLYHSLVAQEASNFAVANTLNDVSSNLRKLGELAVSASFSLYRASCLSPACPNSTRVVYVNSYLLMKNVTKRINFLVDNLPATLNEVLAKSIEELVKDTERIVVLAYAHAALAEASSAKDFALLGQAPCPAGVGTANWLPSACYYISHSSKPSPCSQFYGFVSYYIGLKDLSMRLCGG